MSDTGIIPCTEECDTETTVVEVHPHIKVVEQPAGSECTPVVLIDFPDIPKDGNNDITLSVTTGPICTRGPTAPVHSSAREGTIEQPQPEQPAAPAERHGQITGLVTDAPMEAAPPAPPAPTAHLSMLTTLIIVALAFLGILSAALFRRSNHD